MFIICRSMAKGCGCRQVMPALLSDADICITGYADCNWCRIGTSAINYLLFYEL
jgi:hypothetical protein